MSLRLTADATMGIEDNYQSEDLTCPRVSDPVLVSSSFLISYMSVVCALTNVRNFFLIKLLLHPKS